MKSIIKTLLFSMISLSVCAQSGFKAEQLKFERVKTAYEQKWPDLMKDLKTAKLSGRFSIFMAAYKAEGKLEVWLLSIEQSQYRLFKTYDFCAHSGTLGPKLKEGDGQTPEGFYSINVFNPMSNFYLSLGVDYPNALDLRRSGSLKPGGDIYIHGNCVTVGCIPLTDEKIKELYPLVVTAKDGGQQKIPVHIYPFKMTADNLKQYLLRFPQQKEFWTNLKQGYDHFEKYKLPANVSIKGDRYVIK